MFAWHMTHTSIRTHGTLSTLGTFACAHRSQCTHGTHPRDTCACCTPHARWHTHMSHDTTLATPDGGTCRWQHARRRMRTRACAVYTHAQIWRYARSRIKRMIAHADARAHVHKKCHAASRATMPHAQMPHGTCRVRKCGHIYATCRTSHATMPHMPPQCRTPHARWHIGQRLGRSSQKPADLQNAPRIVKRGAIFFLDCHQKSGLAGCHWAAE